MTRRKSQVHDNLAMGDPRKHITEDIKRSDHNDWATAEELKKRSYTGLRYNRVIDTVEIWLHGNLEKSITAKDGIPDPKELGVAWQEVFGIPINYMTTLGDDYPTFE